MKEKTYGMTIRRWKKVEHHPSCVYIPKKKKKSRKRGKK